MKKLLILGGGTAGTMMTNKLLFGLDEEWIDWSTAFDDFPLKLNDGENAKHLQ